MKKFTVPPVVFPAGGIPTATVGSLHQRRVPTPPLFQPPRPYTPFIPFVPFDIDPTSYSATVHGGGAATTTSFSDEKPLLEELEIDPTAIYRKTVSLLNPVRIDTNLHGSPDLSGPFTYYMFLCFFQMLAGKLQFGVVLGWIAALSIALYVVFNMLEGKNGNLDLYRCLSLVGYSLLPVVIFSAVSLFLPRGGILILALGAVFVLWSTRICTKLVVEGALGLGGSSDHTVLIAYPCFLIYSLFSMLVLF